MQTCGFEDLSDDWTLKGHPRIRYAGRHCPSVGEYPLLRRIGQGGMGDVFSSVHPRLGLEVAVKLLRRDLSERDPTIRRRFLREARLAARLSATTPHLVRVHDVDVDSHSGIYFLVMEYVHGVSAARWAGNRPSNAEDGLPEGPVLECVLSATRGLACAHREGVIHRDIKPDNILIPVSEGFPQVSRAKLADLGLARTDQNARSVSTAATALLGTPGFASPEQIESSQRARKPADVFSMGATLYALLTGRPPFDSETPMGRALATVKGQMKPLIEQRPDVSPPVLALVETCLEHEPDRRFLDASALLKALEVCRTALAGASTRDEAATRVIELRHHPEEGRSVISTHSGDSRSGPTRLTLHGGAPGAIVELRAKDGGGASYSFELDDSGRFETNEVDPGSFHLAAQHDDFHPFEAFVQLRPGVDAHCLLSMREREGYLVVDSTPHGALVFLDGRQVASTPTPRFAVPAGKHELRIRKKGFGEFTRRVDVRGGLESNLGTIELDPTAWLDASDVAAEVTILVDDVEQHDRDEIQPGVRQLELRRPGYEAQRHRAYAVAGQPLHPKPGPWRPNAWALLSALEQWSQAESADRNRAAEALARGMPQFTFRGLQSWVGGTQIAVFLHGATGLEFVLLPGGSFTMGSPRDEPARRSDERLHGVELAPFLVARVPVTQRAWTRVLDKSPARFAGSQLPVENVSWNDAMRFCEKSALALPSEAQWEYACRAGSSGPRWFDDDRDAVERHCWYRGNADGRTRDVGRKPPNAFGLHDMLGGVWEWCRDGYAEYPFEATSEPVGREEATYRVFRGGSWCDRRRVLRAARRGAYRPEFRSWNVGFRPALTVSAADLPRLDPEDAPRREPDGAHHA